MAETIPIHIIARIHTDFATKFGVPRQSGLVPALRGEIVFAPEYRNPDAFRGIQEFSHLWLIWEFSQAVREHWQPTVRPPRLGGNAAMGVFATRSPYRPNPIGLSSVRLESVEERPGLGKVLVVSGADLMDGTPILDIKPYLPYVDCRREATGGFTDRVERKMLQVHCSPDLLEQIPGEKREALLGVLAQDPRPAYQKDPERRYGLSFGGYDVGFTVRDGVLTVTDICKLP